MTPSSKSRPQREDALRRLLADRGIRVTEQRMIILRELDKLRVPVSHAELTERLAGTVLDRTTIYRNLLTMTDAGLLVRTQLGDSVARFELPHGNETHHDKHPHFFCTDCGAVACLPENSVTLKGFVSKSRIAEVQIKGLCVDCAH